MTKVWYKVIERRIPGDPANGKKWFASIVPRSRIKRRDLIDEISRTTSLMKADVSSVMEAFLEEATRMLLAGMLP